MDQPTDELEEIRRFWDEDAATYDRSPGHHPTVPGVRRAWARTVSSLLPPPPADVLDVGAGTGFLSLVAARAGHRVTALDLSPAMLEHLERAAAAEGLAVTTVVGPAGAPPSGPFDAVMERHLLWTLPDPGATLRAWRQVASRLVVIESVWGDTGPLERTRARLRHRLRRMRGTPADHHGEYPQALRRVLPLGGGTPPGAVLELVGTAGWDRAALVWLEELGRAERRALALPERVLGLSPRFAVVSGSG